MVRDPKTTPVLCTEAYIYLTYLTPYFIISNASIVRGDVSIIFAIADFIVSQLVHPVDFIIHHFLLTLNVLTGQNL